MANNTLLASDNFASGHLASGWAAASGLGYSASQVTGSPFVAEPNVVGTNAGQFWTGLTWPNDQTIEVTIKTLAGGSGSQVYLLARATSITGTSYNGYLVSIGANAIATLYRVDAGVLTQLKQVTGLTIAANDVWSLSCAGAAISVYQNYKRITFAADATYSTGTLGFIQMAAAALTNCQVGSFRGYNTVQQDGIWQKQGLIIPATAADLVPNAGGVAVNTPILYEGNAQILSGTVYKMWFTSSFTTSAATATGNISYAESTDGINWTRYHTTVLNGYMTPGLIKNGSTYYMYVQPSSGNNVGDFALYTSTDGINWTQISTTVIGLGSAGQWDSTLLIPFNPIAIIGGTWYALYSAGNSNVTFEMSTGLATSSDGITWTKYAGNPVISHFYQGAAAIQVGSTWYIWGITNLLGQGGPDPDLDPAQAIRYQSTDLINWTNPVNSAKFTQLFEGVNTLIGGVGITAIRDIGGKAYAYLSCNTSDASPFLYQIGLAIGPTTIEQIITGNEDAAQQVATDSFTSGAGSLNGNWTTQSGLSAPKVVGTGPYYVEPTALSTSCYANYTGASFSANQYSEITIQTMASGCILAPAVRCQAGSEGLYFIYNLIGPTGSACNTAIGKIVAGTFTQIGPTIQITPNVGDVFRLQVITGSDGLPTLTAFQNGLQFLQVQDQANALTTGAPGLGVYAVTSLSNAQIAKWTGGNANVIPSYSTGVYMSAPLSGTLTNAAGQSLGFSAKTTVQYQSTPIAICFTDINGNEYTSSGASVGSYITNPLPVVLCNSSGQPLTPPFVFTSGSGSVSYSSTLTGNKLPQPTPVTMTDQNGQVLTLSGFTTGSFISGTRSFVLCDSSGNALSLSVAT